MQSLSEQSCYFFIHTNKLSAGKHNLTGAKNGSALLSRLYIASQSRGGDLDSFFRHENQPYPAALSLEGEIRHGVKSDLLSCLPVPNVIATTQFNV